MANYDHNRKAGNEGDIVKHVALMAALDSVSSGRFEEEFCFMDLYAGYAHSEVVGGNEWENGNGVIHGRAPEISDDNVGRYFRWYLPRPSLIGGIYPGSSLIAHDVLTHNGAIPRLTLFDIAPKPVESLRRVFGEARHGIHHRAAEMADIRRASPDDDGSGVPKAGATETVPGQVVSSLSQATVFEPV